MSELDFTQRNGVEHTVQHVCLCRWSLASALERASIDKVNHNAIGQLLPVLIGRVRSAEFGQMKAFRQTFGLLYTVRDMFSEQVACAYIPHFPWRQSEQGCQIRRSRPIFASTTVSLVSLRYRKRPRVLTKVSGNCMLRSPT